MTGHFDTDREKAEIDYKGKKRTFYIRELGYYEFQDINRDAATAYPDDKEQRGRSMMVKVSVAAIEDEKGKPIFTEESWLRVPRVPSLELTNKALLQLGIDMEKLKEMRPTEDSEEDPPGNV